MIKKILLLAMLSVVLAGCSSIHNAVPYTPNYAAIDQLKFYQLNTVALDNVQPPYADASVNQITLRGMPLTATNGTFTAYLQQALMSDLIEAHIYNPAASLHLSLTLLENDINVLHPVIGSGVMAVLLELKDSSGLRFSKNYKVTMQFDSSLYPDSAMEIGQNAYPRLVKKLLTEIYKDKQFIAALKK